MEEELKKAPTGSPQGGEMAEEVQAQEQQAQEPLKGRAAFLERYRGYHPDLEDEPDDDTMWDFAGQGLSERDDLRGKYDTLNGANEKLAAVVGEDPRVAQFVAMIANGENPMYALGKTFGNLVDEVDDEALEQLRGGQKEYKERYDRMRNNFNTYEATLKGYAEKNGLTDEQVSEINNAILDIAEALNEGDIPEEVIDNVWKGMDYDNEKTAEIEAAKLAGKNEAIDDIKSKKSAPAPLPDLGVQKTNKRAPIKMDEPKMETLASAIVDKD